MSIRSRLHKRPLALLWLGVFALVLNSLGGLFHARTAGAAGGLIEICTPQGIAKIDPTASAADQQQPVSRYDAGHDSGKPRCCDLCAACSAPAVAASTAPILNVVLAAIDAQAPPADIAFPVSHPALTPLVPRGPPALS